MVFGCHLWCICWQLSPFFEKTLYWVFVVLRWQSDVQWQVEKRNHHRTVDNQQKPADDEGRIRRVVAKQTWRHITDGMVRDASHLAISYSAFHRRFPFRLLAPRNCKPFVLVVVSDWRELGRLLVTGRFGAFDYTSIGILTTSLPVSLCPISTVHCSPLRFQSCLRWWLAKPRTYTRQFSDSAVTHLGKLIQCSTRQQC